MRRSCLACALAVAVAAAAAPEALAGSKTVRGESLARQLRAGGLVVREGVVVDGPLDLSGTEFVRRAFKCRKCTFRGRVSAPDVTFERTVDLSGSSFAQDVDFRSATFRAPALFRTALPDEEDAKAKEQPLVFQRRADFSLAFFEELASFAGSEFEAWADFRDARFADAAFASTIFGDTAAFDRASFRGDAVFNHAEFEGLAAFAEADFRHRADFSLASFNGGGNFVRAQFADDASFLAATFYSSPDSEQAARFQNVASAGNLNFTFAVFEVGHQPARSEIAVFSDLACGSSLVFRDATFAEERQIAMNRLQVRDLVMDVDVASRIDGEDNQRGVLQTIEESAKARGDLAVANDAHYALRVMRSRHYGVFWRSLDYVFYRGVAGYFVRPARPLLLLLGLVTLLALIRVAGSGSEPSPAASRWRPRRLWDALWRRGGAFLTYLLDSFSLLGPRWGAGDGAELPLRRRLESFAYRLLVVCGLLGLANSNPTLRDMVDTLF